MTDPTPARLSRLLGSPSSPLRAELAALIVDAALAQPLGTLIDRDVLRDELLLGLSKAHADAIATRNVLPAIARIAAALEGRAEQLGDLISPAAAAQLAALVRRDDGPRFAWLHGAIDSDDVRQLIAPITQQLLMQFASKLPIPGFGGGGGGGGGGLGGLVGKLGKQVQRSAGQLADVGRSMLGGVVRDFNQTATSEFRVALEARMKSPEGKQIVARMRDRWRAHVLAANVDVVVQDLMKLPRAEIAQLVTEILAHSPGQPLIRALIEQELDAQLASLSELTVEALLGERGPIAPTRARLIAAVDAGVASLAQAAALQDWFERLLGAAAEGPGASAHEIVVATTNPNKVREIGQVLAPLGYTVRGLDGFGRDLPEPAEDEDTFEGNARIKAQAYAGMLGLSVLAEDSGLEVTALGGAPGVHSARYAGASGPREQRDRANNEKLVAELAKLGEVDRSARFVCAMCLVAADGSVLFETRGSYEGVILDAPRGENGFGYDPLLLVPELNKTSAELSPEEKNQRSHRGAATRALAQFLARR